MDSILAWNTIALEANRVSHTRDPKEQPGPVLSARALAIVHLAIYDAFAALSGGAAAGLAPYLPNLPPAPAGASADAAVAGAAHRALVALYPSQQAYFDSVLSAAATGGPAEVAGRNFGRAVAEALLADRNADPNASSNGYVTSPLRGRHRVDPSKPTQGVYAPFFGARSRCFAVTQRHGLLPPPAVDTPEYLAALRQVRALGIAPELAASIPEVQRRTPEQSLIGVFWGYDGAVGLGTPPRLYNQLLRKLAILRQNTPAQNARLFALANVAMADAGILAWEQKFKHDLWRPVLGIREQSPTLGPLGTGGATLGPDCDPNWLPFGAPATNSVGTNTSTPNFPSYPSGHATFGAAAFQIVRLFYGASAPGPDTLLQNLSLISDELNGENVDNHGVVRPKHARTFPGGLWQAIVENAFSRVYLGVHWVIDAFALDASGAPDLTRNIGGVPLGITIANAIFDSGMQRSNVGPANP